MKPLNDAERDALLNALAHAAALYERLPSNWIRIGETQVVQGILATLAPPPRRPGDTAQPMALTVARKHLAELFKRAESSRSARHRINPAQNKGTEK